MNCPNCQTHNEPAAQYCVQCGHTLAATMVQSRTVVDTSAPVISTRRAKTIATRAANSFSTPAMPLHSMNGDSAQREHTIVVNDISGSMSEDCQSGMNKLEAAVRATATMIVSKGQVDPLDEVALVVFNSKSQVLLPISPIQSCRSDFLQTLQSLTPSNGTDINEGLKCARDAFGWSHNDVVRRIVLLTDGHGGDPLRTAEDLKSRGVVIDVIGVGDDPSNVHEKLLKKVCSTIQGELRYRFIRDQQTLLAHYTALAGKTATA